MDRRISALAIFASFAGPLAAASSAHAQTGATLTGRVIDSLSGEPIADAMVVVTSNSLQGEQSVVTDAAGFYRLPGLPAGVYTVQIFHGTHQEYTISDVELRNQQTIRVNGRLVPSGADVLEVEVEAPSVDVGSSTVGASVDGEFVQRVPIMAPEGVGGMTRSFEALAQVSPGAQDDGFGVSVSGTTSAENQYRIDGVSVGSPALGSNSSPLSVEFIDEVNVVDGGYMPEFGRSIGGAITATTKSGGNETHGSVWLAVNPGALGGIPEPTPTAGNAILITGRTKYQADAGFTIGGAIIQDRLWYFAGFQIGQLSTEVQHDFVVAEEALDKDDEPTGEAGTASILDGYTRRYTQQLTTLQALAKLTYAVNKDHRLSFSASYLPAFNGNDKHLAVGIGMNGDESTFQRGQDDHVVDMILHWEGASADKAWNFDTALAWHYESHFDGPRDRSRLGSGSDALQSIRGEWSPTGGRNLTEFVDLDSDDVERCEPRFEEVLNDDGEPEIVKAYDPCPVTAYATGGIGEVNEDKLYRVQARHSTSYSFAAAGHHTAKIGADFEYIEFTRTKGTTGGTILLEQEWGQVEDYRRLGILIAPDEVVDYEYMISTTSSPMWGAFIQDSWSIMDKVTLNAGVRYDGQYMVAADRIWASLTNQFAPRVGLVWDPTQKGRSKIYANYARYYQGLVLLMAEINGQIESKIVGVYGPDGCAGARKGGDFESCNGPDNTWSHDGQQSNQMFGTSGAAPTLVDPNLKPSSSDEIVAGLEYEVIHGLRAAIGYRKRWMNQIVEDMSRDDGVTYFLGNPGYGVGLDFPKATRDYDAVWLELNKRFSNQWSVRGNYTMSWLRGNYSGFIKPEILQVYPSITSDFDLLSMLPNRSGYLPNDHRHRIRLWGNYEFLFGERFSLNAGASFSAVSGAPISYMGSHPDKGNYESFLLKRGAAGRMPWVFDISGSLMGKLKLGASSNLGLGIEVYNIANFQAATMVDQAYTFESAIAPLEEGSTKEDLDAAIQAFADGDDTIDFDDVKNPNFGNTSAYQNPRAVRISLRFEF